MQLLWVPFEDTKASLFPVVPLISLVDDEGTLALLDCPLKIGHFSYLVPKEEGRFRDVSPPASSDPTRRREDRLVRACRDVTEGIYQECPDFEQYVQAMLDAEVTIVRNVLAGHKPAGEEERLLLERLEQLCERRWRQEPALDIIDKIGADMINNRGVIEFLVCHMKVVLQTHSELAKLEPKLLNTLATELLRIQSGKK
ncbi:uncharacterized protein LOC119095097 [Pollicipes pollicipes]|uniref:uncharacterized protein LOC119095097 n=1 Tax=Pollicipes pollicipes TaxID=41117 RepID=UPI0018859039|nr:uncharacterized protein LOC119095097 [Pollicipes pollicipes]